MLSGFTVIGYYLQKTHEYGRDKYGFIHTGSDQTPEFIEYNNSATQFCQQLQPTKHILLGSSKIEAIVKDEKQVSNHRKQF